VSQPNEPYRFQQPPTPQPPVSAQAPQPTQPGALTQPVNPTYAPSYPQAYGNQYSAPATPPGQGLSIAGLILGIVLGPAAFIGIILSAIGYRKNKAVGAPTGLSVAGIVVSSLFFVFSLLVIIALTVMASDLMSTCMSLGPGTHYVDGMMITCGS
jgi:hypothetical protein